MITKIFWILWNIIVKPNRKLKTVLLGENEIEYEYQVTPIGKWGKQIYIRNVAEDKIFEDLYTGSNAVTFEDIKIIIDREGL